MPSPSDRSMIHMGRWPAGVENVPDELSLSRSEQTGAQTALREARNVDLDAQGRAARRRGYARVGSSARVHSLWSESGSPFALVVQNGTLTALRPGLAMQTVRAGVDENLPASYALTPRGVYWSNDETTGLVLPDGTDAPWGLPTPATPVLSAVDGIGGLAAGTYQVTATLLDALGEESGAPLAATVDVAAGGGIQVAPADPLSAGVKIQLYRSEADASVLRRVAVANAAGGVVLGKQYLGAPLATQFMDPMPAGAMVAYYQARTWTAHADVLTFSEPFRLGLTLLEQNRITFAAPISMLAPMLDGMFVGTRTSLYWLAGADPAQMSAQRRYAGGNGVVRGTQIRVRANVFGLDAQGLVAYWLCHNGVACIGSDGGIVTPLRDGRAVAPEATRGASVYREQDGRRQVVTTLVAASERGLAMGDRAECEVIRHDQ